MIANRKAPPPTMKEIQVIELSGHEFATPDGVKVLRASADPSKMFPFISLETSLSPDQAATLAYGILTVLRNAVPTDMETEKAIDETLLFLGVRANLGILPF